jgi:ABC-2 type transport system permease protein
MRQFRMTLHAVALSFEMAVRQAATDSFVIFAVLFQPMLIAVLALWMLKEREAGNAIFVVVGSALTGLWSSVLFVCGNSITQERWTGTLETLIGLPTPMSVIVFGKNLAFTVQSLLSMVVSYILAAWLFGFPLRVDQPFLFAISAVFMVISFVSLGMLIAPVFLISPAVQQWQNALDYPIYMLCGFLFPVALLPNWTTPLSYSLAPYWAARALHASSSGGDLGEIVFSWVIMVVLSVVYVVISRYLFRVLERRARVDATLGMS